MTGNVRTLPAGTKATREASHPAGSKAVNTRAVCESLIDDISRLRQDIPEGSPLEQFAMHLQKLCSMVWLIAKDQA